MSIYSFNKQVVNPVNVFFHIFSAETFAALIGRYFQSIRSVHVDQWCNMVFFSDEIASFNQSGAFM